MALFIVVMNKIYKQYTKLEVTPTHLARNEKKKSIEFIKEYKIKNDFVLVSVRVSNNNVHFARTMYVMSAEKVKKYFRHKYFYKFQYC